jgi:predicted DNA binding CopG/RHH family protein
MQFDLQINRELDRLRKTAKKKGLPYQSLVNEILAGEMRKAS